jgi:hypothetical protein
LLQLSQIINEDTITKLGKKNICNIKDLVDLYTANKQSKNRIENIFKECFNIDDKTISKNDIFKNVNDIPVIIFSSLKLKKNVENNSGVDDVDKIVQLSLKTDVQNNSENKVAINSTNCNNASVNNTINKNNINNNNNNNNNIEWLYSNDNSNLNNSEPVCLEFEVEYEIQLKVLMQKIENFHNNKNNSKNDNYRNYMDNGNGYNNSINNSISNSYNNSNNNSNNSSSNSALSKSLKYKNISGWIIISIANELLSLKRINAIDFYKENFSTLFFSLSNATMQTIKNLTGNDGNNNNNRNNSYSKNKTNAIECELKIQFFCDAIRGIDVCEKIKVIIVI